MAWALTPGYDGVMSAKTKFYLSLATSALFALAAIVNAVMSQWWVAGLLGTAAVVNLGVAFWRRKMTDA
jgi:hypothetical protein